MVSPVLIAIFVALFFYRFYKYSTYRPPNFPPGPPRIPLLGSFVWILLINHKVKHFAINTLCAYYKSSVIGFYTGAFITVVANDPKSVREMLFKQEFDGRNDTLLARLRDPDIKPNRGIFFVDGNYWLHQRRFTLRNLRDFGFGRRYQDYEVEVNDEIQSFVNLIKEGSRYEHERKYFKAGGLVCLPKALIGVLGNCFLQVAVGERFARADQAELFKAGEAGFKFQRNGHEYGNIFTLLPWFRLLFPELSSYKQCRESSMIMYDFMKKIVDRHIATYQSDHARSFLDIYIKELKEAETTDQSTGFQYDQLMMIMADLQLPSLTSLPIQASFFLRLVAHKPSVAKKIQEEIELVVGSGRLPTLDDRVNLPYTEAALRESLRIETLAPSSVPHRTMEATTLAGFDIPKNTFALACLHTLHNDKELWKDPENFRPERFLDFKGNLSLKKDVSLPFGAGRRLCAGETFSRNTMFLCVTALLQNFNLKLAGENRDLHDNYSGLNNIPNDFWIEFQPR